MERQPFTLDRNDRRSLADQLVDNIRNAVRMGMLKPGETLPTLEQVAKGNGVSLIVVRQAYRRLAKLGVVQSRPRLGTVVMPQKGRTWKGNVVLVTTERYENYLVSVIAGVLSHRLLQSGYLISHVVIFADGKGKADFGLLDATLSSSVDLAIVLFDRWNIARHVVQSGVPCISVGHGVRPPKGCVGFVRYDVAAVVPDFVARCCSAGVASVGVVSAGSRIPDVESPLREMGIRVNPIAVVPVSGCGVREGVERGAFRHFSSLLAKKKWRCPDLLFFNDDFAARGAITALLAAGVSIPRDVRVVTWANFGDEPVFPFTLSRMEMDPFASGESLSCYVLSFLSGKRIPKPPVFHPVYCSGESFGTPLS